MEQKDLHSWEEFEEKIALLSKDHSSKKSNATLGISDYLFRGYTDSSWELDTTLERYGCNFTFQDYYHSIHAAKVEIEAVTGTSWEIPTPPKVLKNIEDREFLKSPEIPGYNYLIYMRHHGFPSPFLDWTRSPYIAAFFAFNAASKLKYITIYVYQQYLGEGISGREGTPFVRSLGPYVKSHKRHFLQQSEYTICLISNDKSVRFSSHEEFFKNNKDHQDRVWKFNIPTSEKLKVLKRLGITSFLLFNNEESLMNTMEMRELYFKNKRV